MKGHEVLRKKEIGQRVIMNTNHPIMLMLTKQGPGNWIVTIVCNGIGEYAKKFGIKREANHHFDDMVAYKKAVAREPGQWRIRPDGAMVREEGQ